MRISAELFPLTQNTFLPLVFLRRVRYNEKTTQKGCLSLKPKIKKRNILKWIGVFFGSFLIYHIILSPFFPVSEANVLLAPDWYDDVGIIISMLTTVSFANKHKFTKRLPQAEKDANTAPHINSEQKEVASKMAQNPWNWDDFGKNIQNTVDNAVNSQNYQKLNETVRKAVNQAVDAGNNLFGQVTEHISNHSGSQAINALYGKTLGKTIKSFLKIFSGFFLATTGYLGFLGSLMDPDALSESLGAYILTLTFLAVGIWLVCSGIKTRAMVKRFKVYKQILGAKTHCPIKMLASSVGKSEAFVRKELLVMIQKGFFREGHLDKEQANLITSHETFMYYEQSRMQFEAQRREASVKNPHKPSRDPKVQEVLDRGTSFIAQIRKCNDDIPGEVISEKIAHIELLVQRIFQRAQAHPEIVPDLKKLMDYYLPMTVKLLNAYADMDSQPIQGETIVNSKREIEATLDTLTLAFEKLLDDLFVDTAMDVSSDISVLNTLLAQEGLTEDDFSNLKPQQ